ncbi:MAG: hypothetical protein Q9201_002658 [Fulgogasparrea decipioides]
MAYHHSDHIPWHEGEDTMHRKLHASVQDNPTSSFLTPYAARLLLNAPLLALGTLDNAGRPWTTLLGGEVGFVRPLGQSNVGIRTSVDPTYDPVVNTLLGSKHRDGPEDSTSKNHLVSGLGIDLATRSRVKLAGRVVASALDRLSDELQDGSVGVTEAQMVVKIEQSLGLCPKYLNKKQIVPTLPEPGLVSDALPLPLGATRLLAKADLFFISSSHDGMTMGTNNRGGPPGFVRVVENDSSGTALVYPEYSGNRLYQTLGNLQTTPRAGIVIPDFDSGDVLYVTGTTQILVGPEAAGLLPRSNLAVKVHVEEARLVSKSLPFRGKAGEPSPYNPPVRFLVTERSVPNAQNLNGPMVFARLIKKELLTPSIGRFQFSIHDAEAVGRWKPGQYVTLAFEDELGAGYSHMRDDDPVSLNDDLLRTFTVSSPSRGGLPEDEFDITIRNVGKVTAFLFRQNVRAGLEIPLKGIGGAFNIQQPDGEVVPFVAGGIGITPLLAHLPDLDLGRIRLFWAVRIQDVGLAIDTFERCPRLASSTRLFISGAADAAVRGQEPQTNMPRLEQYGAQVVRRRMVASDIQGQQDLSTTWYVCAGSKMRQTLLSWLSGKEIIFEDFDY